MIMVTVVSAWGNSLGIRIPKSISESCKLTEKTKVNVDIEEKTGNIIIKKIADEKRHITLEERAKLCKGWDGKPYKLTDEDKEWLNMPAVGKEIV
jgi:antitoxin component of MazEF toxin-antitoxin module